MTEETAPTGDPGPTGAQGARAADSLHRSAPEVAPVRALAVSTALLALWAAVTIGAHPLAAAVSEALLRAELAWMAGEWPWTW